MSVSAKDASSRGQPPKRGFAAGGDELERHASSFNLNGPAGQGSVVGERLSIRSSAEVIDPRLYRDSD